MFARIVWTMVHSEIDESRKPLLKGPNMSSRTKPVIASMHRQVGRERVYLVCRINDRSVTYGRYTDLSKAIDARDAGIGRMIRRLSSVYTLRACNRFGNYDQQDLDAYGYIS